jgi:hypothetical protein
MERQLEHWALNSLPAWSYRQFPMGPSITRRRLRPEKKADYLLFLQREEERVESELERARATDD